MMFQLRGARKYFQKNVRFIVTNVLYETRVDIFTPCICIVSWLVSLPPSLCQITYGWKFMKHIYMFRIYTWECTQAYNDTTIFILSLGWDQEGVECRLFHINWLIPLKEQ